MYRFRRSALGLGFIAAFWVAWTPSTTHAQAEEPTDTDSLQLVLRSEVKIASNVIRLKDLCELSIEDSRIESYENLPIAPTPRPGVLQSWSRADLANALNLRGIASENIQWSGAEHVRVQRTHAETANPSTSPPQSIAATTSTSFAPAFTNPVSIAQAERVVASAIESYLHLQTGTQGKWTIRPNIPPQHANQLLQRRQIISIGGGKAPWDGQQKFTLLLRTSEGESAIDLDVEIRLPDMVVAAKGPLAKGRVLQESDLVWLPLPLNSKISAEECFTDFKSLIGQQLRKSVSTKQAIRQNEVGRPFSVQAGESVSIAVLAGPVRVESAGRAIESGAIDEIVQVEVLPQRKRIAARVVSERKVEVIANGAPRVAAEP